MASRQAEGIPGWIEKQVFTSDLYRNINGIRKLVISPCSPTVQIYVETFFPAATLTLFLWIDQATPIQLLRAGGLGKSIWGFEDALQRGIRPTNTSRRGRRGCSSGISPYQARRLAPNYMGPFKGASKAIWFLDERIFRAFFWYAVAEIVSGGIYRWMSLAHRLSFCEEDYEHGPWVNPTTTALQVINEEGLCTFDTTGSPPWIVNPEYIFTSPGQITNVSASITFGPWGDSQPSGIEVRIVLVPVGGTAEVMLASTTTDLSQSFSTTAVVETRFVHVPIVPAGRIMVKIKPLGLRGPTSPFASITGTRMAWVAG